MKTLLPLALLALFPIVARAQISTERPGLTYSPSPVERGAVQFEMGTPQVVAEHFTLSDGFREARYSFTSYSFPLVVRYGLGEKVELRAGTSLYDGYRVKVGSRSESDGELGFDVVTVGAKIGLLDGSGGRPAVSLTPEFGFRPAGGGSSVSLFGAVGFTPAQRLTGNVTAGFSGPTDSFFDNVQGLFAASLGASLSPALSAYGETGYLTSPGDDSFLLGGGLLLLVAPRVQLDASFDMGLNAAAPDLMYGLGLSFRL